MSEYIVGAIFLSVEPVSKADRSTWLKIPRDGILILLQCARTHAHTQQTRTHATNTHTCNKHAHMQQTNTPNMKGLMNIHDGSGRVRWTSANITSNYLASKSNTHTSMDLCCCFCYKCICHKLSAEWKESSQNYERSFAETVELINCSKLFVPISSNPDVHCTSHFLNVNVGCLGFCLVIVHSNHT